MQKFSLAQCKVVAVRSRGPGGQNVNKVSSAIQLFWDYRNDPKLSETEKLSIQEKLTNYINSEGLLVIRTDEYRDQLRNKERAFEKLGQIISKALFKPKPRKATKPTYSSQVKRQDKKKARGQIKSLRKKVDYR